MKQAIIYCRFSPRPNADECKSNEKQEERCRAYCARAGYEVATVCWDTAASGRKLERVGLNDALSALQSGFGTVLVIDTSDRLARDMLVSLTIRHRIAAAGATLEFADGSTPEDTPEGRLFSNFLAAIAQYDRERFARRTKAGLAKKKANGEHLGRVPIGWQVDPETKQLVKNEEEQFALEHIRHLSQQGISSNRIANRLTEWWGNIRGKPWSARTVRRILARQSK